MRILVVHNRYRNRAGEDSVFDQEVKFLEQNGHQVNTLMADNLDIKTKTIWQKIILAVDTIWSQKSYKKMTEYLREFKPDVVHVHNFLPLFSPSIFYACKKLKIPVVQTIHNYRLGCPAATFFRGGKICELCIQKSLLPSIRYRCYRGSFFQTATVAMMLQIHRWLGTWNNIINGYIALTPFMKSKLIEIGIPEHKIYIKPNFIVGSPQASQKISFGKYYLFVGRLTQEKGISILLDAYQQAHFQYPLVIIGSGELTYLVEKALQNNPKIKYLGYQPKEKVLEYMREAIALIFPSIWYEGFPLTILEAYSQSLPIIAADIGSVNCAVKPQLTGLLYPPYKVENLKDIIQEVESKPEQWLEIKKNLNHQLDSVYFPEANLENLLSIYQQIISHQ